MHPRLLSVGTALLALSYLVPVCIAAEPGEGFHVFRYDLELTPNLQTKTVSGAETLKFESLTDDLRTIVFSGNALTIDSVTLGTKPVQLAVAGNDLSLTLPISMRKGKTATGESIRLFQASAFPSNWPLTLKEAADQQRNVASCP